MAPNNTADVYVIDYMGAHQHVGKGINKDNLMFLSVSARNAFQAREANAAAHQNRAQQNNGAGAAHKTFMLQEHSSGAPTVNPDAAGLICKWIDCYDPAKPEETQFLIADMLPATTGGPTFQQVVQLYHTGYGMHIPRERRGNALRDDIYSYIHNGPLSANEFHMIHDLLAFDGGLLKTAQHTVMYAQVHGSESPKSKDDMRVNKIVKDKDGVWHVYQRPDAEEFKKIEAFARERGVWEDMEDARRFITRQKEEGLLESLLFQMREARRLRNRQQLNILGPQIAAQQNVIKGLKDETAAINADREAKAKAREEAIEKAQEAGKMRAEQEEARKAKRKPQ